MKKGILSFLLWMLLVLPAAAQVGVDLGFGSQSAKIRAKDEYLQYFSLSPSVRYQASSFFVKIGTRQGLGRTTTLRAYELEKDINGNYGYGKETEIGVKFRESGFGFGLGITFTGTESLTRPYLLFEYFSMKKNFDIDNPSQPMSLYEYLGSIREYDGSLGPVNGKKIQTTTGQFRFSAGFQFEINNGFTLFNEASINLNNNEQFFVVNFSIDLGLRYFLMGTK